MNTIKQALKAALEDIDIYDYTMTVEESEKFAKAERLCKSALAELESVEPVAYADEDNIDLGISIKQALIFKACTRKSEVFNTPLYTSPPQREWVGLSYQEILECLPEGAQRVPQGWQNVYDSIEDKLRKLNTKG